MAGTAESVLHDIFRRVAGRKVLSTTLAANSLIVDVEMPTDETELWFWFEPTWHIGCEAGVLVGSRQAQVEDKPQHDEVGQIAAQLVGRAIDRIALDALTRDITMRFSGGYWLRTFVSDPNDEEIWYVRDKARSIAVGASPREFFIRHVEPLSRPAER